MRNASRIDGGIYTDKQANFWKPRLIFRNATRATYQLVEIKQEVFKPGDGVLARARGLFGRGSRSGAHLRRPDRPPAADPVECWGRGRRNCTRPARKTSPAPGNPTLVPPKTLESFEKGRSAAIEGCSSLITNAYGSLYDYT
jgi:hypothetical protein